MRTSLLSIPALLATLLSGACLDVSDGKAPELGTYVQDWREEIVYQVLVDRFANGDRSNDFGVRPGIPARYHGGDWKGLEDNLDYLGALGVTAVWISPVVKNVETDAGVDGYHGYWAQDLTQPNPHFGDIGALRRLVRRCHERGIKVIVDIVTNHMGQLFFYDINQNGQPDVLLSESGLRKDRFGNVIPVEHVTEYDPDWDPRGVQASTSLGESGLAPIIFPYDPATNKLPAMPAIFQRASSYHRRGRVVDYEATVKRCETDHAMDCGDCPGVPCVDYYEQTELGDFPGGLKDIATEDPAVREALIEVYVQWVVDTNIDGFRIDTLKHVEHGFWQTFAPEVRRRLSARGKTNFLLFGESFDGDDARNGAYTRPGELDAVFHFAQKFQVFDDVLKKHGPTRKIEQLWGEREKNYGTEPQEGGVGVAPSKLPVNFLDNHDVPRFLYGESDTRALELALGLLFTQQGIPCVYYGTEQGFSGGNDPANREDLWSSGYVTTGPLVQWLRRLSTLRRTVPALTRGDQRVVYSTDRTGDEPDAGIFAFERRGGDAGASRALIVLNAHPTHASSTKFGADAMKTSFAGETLTDALGSGLTLTIGGDGAAEVTVPSMGIAVLLP